MITRKEIAARANVSVSVVSRALNNSGYVEGEKKRLILEIADELGYRPNPVAMSLMNQRTKQIMYYCRELENAYNIQLYEGMLEEAQKHDYMVVMHGKLDFDSIRNLMVDGLILPSENVTDIYIKNEGKNYNLPVVTASYGNMITLDRYVSMVECNLWDGTNKIIEYLRKMGHRKIAMIMPYEYEHMDARCSAYKESMRHEFTSKIKQYYFGINAKGLINDLRVMEFPEEKYCGNIQIPEDFFGKGLLAADIFNERKCDATAAICFNDDMALGFAKRLRKIGYRIPEDISIVGFDGIYSRKYADTMMTSLCLNPKLHGAKCVEVLLNIINGKKVKHITNIPNYIEVGESVKKLNN